MLCTRSAVALARSGNYELSLTRPPLAPRSSRTSLVLSQARVPANSTSSATAACIFQPSNVANVARKSPRRLVFLACAPEARVPGPDSSPSLAQYLLRMIQLSASSLRHTPHAVRATRRGTRGDTDDLRAPCGVLIACGLAVGCGHLTAAPRLRWLNISTGDQLTL